MVHINEMHFREPITVINLDLCMRTIYKEKEEIQRFEGKKILKCTRQILFAV